MSGSGRSVLFVSQNNKARSFIFSLITLAMSLKPVPLKTRDFAAFGNVIEISDEPGMAVNEGSAQRFNRLVTPQVAASDPDEQCAISLFQSRLFEFPVALAYLERHPLASQAFIPMSDAPFLIVVASDHDGIPQHPCAFVTDGKQGVNYYRNVWHATLTPLGGNGLFAAVDYAGKEDNLELYRFEKPLIVESNV